MSFSSPNSLLSNFQQCLNSYKSNKSNNEKEKMLAALKKMCEKKLKLKITPVKKIEEKVKNDICPICPYDKKEIEEGQKKWECSVCHLFYHEKCICEKLLNISETLDPEFLRYAR